MIDKLKELIEASDKILITSHISPDPDAVSSVLLSGLTLRLNFPKKTIKLILEETPSRDLNFLEGYREIEFRPVLEAVSGFKPDLFILLDAPNFERVSRHDGDKIREMLKNIHAKIAIVDHHQEHGRDTADFYSNNRLPATAQEVYELLFEKLNLKKPKGYAQTTLLGIVSDTQRHRFDNPAHRDTYRVVSDLLDAGASIEELETKMERFDSYQLQVMGNLIGNITDSRRGYTYSFVSDEFTRKWLDESSPKDAFKLACEEFTDRFLKHFEDNLWGFIVYMDIAGEQGSYAASFRSSGANKDVSKIAYSLGGGGHKGAAGARFKASNIEEAVDKVKQAISDAKS